MLRLLMLCRLRYADSAACLPCQRDAPQRAYMLMLPLTAFYAICARSRARHTRLRCACYDIDDAMPFFAAFTLRLMPLMPHPLFCRYTILCRSMFIAAVTRASFDGVMLPHMFASAIRYVTRCAPRHMLFHASIATCRHYALLPLCSAPYYLIKRSFLLFAAAHDAVSSRHFSRCLLMSPRRLRFRAAYACFCFFCLCFLLAMPCCRYTFTRLQFVVFTFTLTGYAVSPFLYAHAVLRARYAVTPYGYTSQHTFGVAYAACRFAPLLRHASLFHCCFSPMISHAIVTRCFDAATVDITIASGAWRAV